MSWYKVSKFITQESAMCGNCMSRLYPIGISISKNHLYPIGQDWSCGCGKSKIWANSIRNEKAFVSHVESGTPYYQGICNDKRCGYCSSWIFPLQNGVEVPGINQRMDRYGCKNCQQNQNIIMDTFKELPENGNKIIEEWYKNRVEDIKGLIK